MNTDDKHVYTEEEKAKRSCINTKEKSNAKANGLKSIFSIDDKLVLTGFGKGNEAVVETEFVNDEQNRIADPGTFVAANETHTFEIVRNSNQTADAGHPTKPTGARKDLIGAKDKLEELYFGKTYNDNLHIQLIYNILDIEKMLAVYVENIAYSLNHVNGLAFKEYDVVRKGKACRELGDVIGENGVSNNLKIKKDAMFIDLVESNRLPYFGNAFYNCGYDTKAKIQKTEFRDIDNIAAIIEMIGGLRQFIVHGRLSSLDWLYQLDRYLKAPHKKCLDSIYEERINSLNKGFVKNNKANLYVAFKALGLQTDEEKKACASSYYDYVVKKESRNVGFNIKKLREQIIIDNYNVSNPQKGQYNVGDKNHDTVRSKLYSLFDFVIYSYYKSEAGETKALDFVDVLRSIKGEEAKEEAYKKEAKTLNDKLKNSFAELCRILPSGNAVKDINNQLKESHEFDGIQEWIDEVKISAANVSYFSKLMYMLTPFLDGKDINTLLTSLINKLENIQSFVDVAKEIDVEMFVSTKSGQNFEFFLDCKKVADEIRTVKSFARMETPKASLNSPMVIDAFRVLGVPESKYDDYKCKMFSKDEKEHKYRNFITNNVIDSSRFRYLIRFADVRKVREFAKSEKLIDFVLSRIPKAQIERYYKTCINADEPASTKEMRSQLSKLITTFSYENSQIEDVDQSKDNPLKQKVTAVISLYLTVLYLIAKNLVNINARYLIAMHSLERDTRILLDEKLTETVDGNKVFHYFDMVEKYIESQEAYRAERFAANKRFNNHALKMVKENYEKVTANKDAADSLALFYRNAVAHLDAVTVAPDYVGEMTEIKSYFDVYHYVMQRYISSEEGFKIYVESKNPDLASELTKSAEFHKFQKDALWLMNVPFAYNLPRYKNLSIADLFNDKEAKPEVDAEE